MDEPFVTQTLNHNCLTVYIQACFWGKDNVVHFSCQLNDLNTYKEAFKMRKIIYNYFTKQEQFAKEKARYRGLCWSILIQLTGKRNGIDLGF